MVTELSDKLAEMLAKEKTAQNSCDALSTKQRGIQIKLDEHALQRGRDKTFKALQQKLELLQDEYHTLSKKRVVFEGSRDIRLISEGKGDRVSLQQRIDDLSQQERAMAAKTAELHDFASHCQEAILRLESESSKRKETLHALECEIANSREGIDWNQAQRLARSLRSQYQDALERLSRIATLNALDGIKEKLRSAEKQVSELADFFDRAAERKTAVEFKELWRRFNIVTEEHEKMSKNLTDERIKLELSKQELSLINKHLTENAQEQTSLKRKLSEGSIGKGASTETELKRISDELNAKKNEIETAQHEINTFNDAADKKTQELMILQNEFRTIQHDLSIRNSELTGLKVETAKLETRREDADREIAHEAPNITLTAVRLLDTDTSRSRIEDIKRQLSVIGGIDEETVKEYSEAKEKHDYLTQQTTDLRHAHKSLIKLIAELDTHITGQFQESFKNINAHFVKYFKRLFSGGTAKIILQTIAHTEEENTDETEEGVSSGPSEHSERSFDYAVEIQATPPGKKLSSVTVLSGGEKALTSIALICAIIANNPPPFVVLDEVDAALDEANSIRFAEIIAELNAKTQFITITHNRATMHQAKLLYGVTMGDDGVSRLLSVNFEEASKISSR